MPAAGCSRWPTPRQEGAKDGPGRLDTLAAQLSAALAAAPLAAHAQTLSLVDALERADGAAHPNRIAAVVAAAQGAQELAALRGVLPNVRLEGGFARTTDPIGAFGIALRQRRIAPPGPTT